MRTLILISTLMLSMTTFADGMSELHYMTGSAVKQVIEEAGGTEIEVGKMKFAKNPPANCTVMVNSKAKFRNTDGEKDSKKCSSCFEKTGNGI